MVECELFDRFGAAWRFIEKLPVIENSTLDSALYPRPGTIACEVIQTGQDDHGRSFLLVDTQRPWGVQSADEVTLFEVFAEQLAE